MPLCHPSLLACCQNLNFRLLSAAAPTQGTAIRVGNSEHGLGIRFVANGVVPQFEQQRNPCADGQPRGQSAANEINRLGKMGESGKSAG